MPDRHIPSLPVWSGATLSAAREGLSLSLKALSVSTRIRRGLFGASESDNFDGLSAPAFLREY
jgi:cytoskeletal protein RodZ